MIKNKEVLYIFLFSILVHIGFIFFTIPINFSVSNENLSNSLEIDLQNFSEDDAIPNLPDIDQKNIFDFPKINKNFNIPHIKEEKINYEKIIRNQINQKVNYNEYLQEANASVDVPFILPKKVKETRGSQQNYKKSNAISNYLMKIKMIIESNKLYPKRAVNANIEGKVKLKFILYKNGIGKNIKVVESSGSKILDNAAVEAIKRSIPFPKFPKDLNKNKIILSLQLIYKLKK